MPLEPIPSWEMFWEGGQKRRSASQETCHRVVRPETGKSSQRAGRQMPLLGNDMLFAVNIRGTQHSKGWPPAWGSPHRPVVVLCALFRRAAERLRGETHVL